MSFRLPSIAAALTITLAVGACSDDESIPVTPIDAAVIDAPAIDAPAIDAPAIDAPPMIDAAIDAAGAGPVNGCTEATAMDRTAPGAARTITNQGFTYTPACIKIAVGQTVTWNTNFASHPLAPGAIVGGAPMAQPGNPIPATAVGNSVTATFSAAGGFGYYCTAHFGASMFGAVFVVP